MHSLASDIEPFVRSLIMVMRNIDVLSAPRATFQPVAIKTISFSFIHRICVLSMILLLTAQAHAVIIISSNSDVVAGRNAYLASGTTQVQFDWDTLPPGSVLATSVTLPDSTVNTVSGLASNHSYPLNIKDWVTEPGFEGYDLAINGTESFDLLFGKGHQSIGLAIITGAGNFPNEFDSKGATFQFTARDASDVVVGTANFSLASNQVDHAWLTINSSTPFRKVEVREINELGLDQYFSDVFTSVEKVNSAPEPTTLALLALGLAGIGFSRRKSPKAAHQYS